MAKRKKTSTFSFVRCVKTRFAFLNRQPQVVEQAQHGRFVGNGYQDGAVKRIDFLAVAGVSANGPRRVDAVDAVLADLALDQAFDLICRILLSYQFDDEIEVLQQGVQRFDAHNHAGSICLFAGADNGRGEEESETETGEADSTHA